MAKPIHVIFPAYVSQNDIDNGFENVPGYAGVKDSLPGAIAAAGVPEDQVVLKRYPMGYEEIEKRLKLRPASGAADESYLPQLLFATTDPNKENGVVVLGKLVKGQITSDNIAILLKTVWRMQVKQDANGKQGFYDPTLHFPVSIGFNPTDAPGGWLIGLNATTYSVELSRYGQMLDDFVSGLKKWWVPLAILAGAVILSNSKKRSSK